MPVQYRVLKAPQDYEKCEPFLNEQAADNWELVMITPGPGHLAVFKKVGASATEEKPS